MTVAELIAKLQKVPQDLPVVVAEGDCGELSEARWLQEETITDVVDGALVNRKAIRVC